MSQATLRTDRLVLVPLSEDHLPFLVELNSDPAVHRFLFHRGLTAEETEDRLRRALSAATQMDGFGRWIGSSDDEPVGLWMLRHGFEDLGPTRIFAQTMAVNQRSRATMVSVGLTFVRTFTEEYEVPIPGHEHGEVEYDITAQRWLTEFGGRRVQDPDPS